MNTTEPITDIKTNAIKRGGLTQKFANKPQMYRVLTILS